MRKIAIILLILIFLIFFFIVKPKITGFSIFNEDYKCSDCNVILIAVETTRADHLGVYGYERDTSPNIDKFAKENIMFENAISQAPWTAPSIASLLTSTYPHVHNVGGKEQIKLSNSSTTLAEILTKQGYKTVGFVTNGVGGDMFNLNQGFEEYTQTTKDAFTFNQYSLKWLRDNARNKFFMFIFYYDPHLPYDPPKPYDKMFYKDYKGPIKYVFLKGEEHPAKVGLYKNKSLTKEDKEYIEALYDGEIRYFDEQFGYLLDELEKLNLLNNTILVFTADHGEEFWEHNSFEHGYSLYNELIHVPLIIKHPKLNFNKKINDLVELVDVMPTILDILDINVNKEAQGGSLVPLINGERIEKPAYSEGNFENVMKKSIRTQEWKLICNYSYIFKECELYNLRDDPDELNNVINEKLGIAEKLKIQLDTWLNSTISTADKKLKISEEEKEVMRSLGYIT